MGAGLEQTCFFLCLYSCELLSDLLLLTFFQERDAAIAMKNSLDAKGHKLRDQSLILLGTMEARLNNLDEAMKYKNIL